MVNPTFRLSARGISLAALVFFGLSACVSTGANKTLSNDYPALLAAAEAEVSAGRVEQALAGFDDAARADPVAKEPWVRTAQLQFDAGNYGRAIVAAEEVLQRDPNDKVADSVLTVGGLRVAAQSLQRLQGNGALASATARVEAERLASTMRETMGADILDAEEKKPARTVRRSRRTPAAATKQKPEAPKKDASNNPFKLLGGG